LKFKNFVTAAELFTGNLNNFRGIFNWTPLIGQTTVIAMRDPLAYKDFNINVHGDHKFYENFEFF
jgi:hypothetical protein